MRRRSAILAAAALLLLCAAPSSAALSNEERLSRLRSAISTKQSGMLTLSTETFKKYIEAQDRSYSLIVYFTAEAKICEPCSSMHTSVSKIAREYNGLASSRRGKRPVFFASLKLTGSEQDFLQRYGIAQVPLLYHFNSRNRYPISKLSGPDFYDVSNRGFGANSLRQFINERTGSRLPVIRAGYSVPFGATVKSARPFLFICLLFALAAVVHFQAYKIPMFWFCVVVTVYIFSVGGGHFSWIHDTPIYTVDRDGAFEFIAAGARTQYVAEGFLVSITCVLISAFIIAVQELPSIVKNRTLLGGAGIVFTVMTYVAITLLMGLYHTVRHLSSFLSLYRLLTTLLPTVSQKMPGYLRYTEI